MRKVAKTTTHLTHKFYNDEFLRDYVAMIPTGGKFLQHSYARNKKRTYGVPLPIKIATELFTITINTITTITTITITTTSTDSCCVCV